VREDQPERWETFSREVAVRDRIAQRLAEKYGGLYVPLQPHFDACCRHMPPRYWLFDGVHPTEAGHELIAREWIKAFGQIRWED
jgi:lysophospholipase L1-like esterase